MRSPCFVRIKILNYIVLELVNVLIVVFRHIIDSFGICGFGPGQLDFASFFLYLIVDGRMAILIPGS